MIGAGMPRATAAAIDSASSLGGQLMPPVMGVSAFLMAEFLGRSYFDVVARGYVPALIYYATVAVSVYLLALRHRMRIVAISFEALTWRDWVNLAAFLTVIAGLVGMMAAWHLAPMFAALYVFVAVGSVLFVVNLVPLLAPGRWSFGEFIRPIRKFLEFIHRDDVRSHAAAGDARDHDRRARHHRRPDQARLAAHRGGRFQSHGHGHPGLCVRRIAGDRPASRADLHPGGHRHCAAHDQGRRRPGSVHFFAFFLGVWGELTPPTSIVAAVTAKIADASFYQTLGRALQICVSLFTLMAGVFIRPESSSSRD